MSSPTKVLYVALDACDAKLARGFAAEGHMPHLAALLESSAVVESRAPTGMFVSSAWPTIYTGCDAVRHGYHCWNEHVAGTYEHRETSPVEVREPPFWAALSTAGHRVAILDVPHTVAVPNLNGVQLVEWGCHDRHVGSHSWPPELIDRISIEFGAHPIGTAPAGRRDVNPDQFAPCDYAHREGRHRTAEENERLFDDLLTGIERKRAASLHLLDQGNWDLFLTVLGETHCAGHQFWSLHDRGHPKHDPALAARIGRDPIRTVYAEVDATLGEHLSRVDDGTTVYVHLSHGMGPHYDGTHLLDGVLQALDAWTTSHPSLHGPTAAIRRLTMQLPATLRRRALQLVAPAVRGRVGIQAISAPALQPIAQRSWFATPNNSPVGGIRINLEGREPAGRVTATEYRQACAWLRNRLLELINLDTGRPAVAAVQVTDDVYRRGALDPFPDLFVDWARDAPIERLWSPYIGVVSGSYDDWRTGDHHPGGLLLARGPGISAGSRRPTIPAIDIAPTVAAAVGTPLPGVDGQAWPDLLPSTAAARPMNTAPAVGRPWERPVLDRPAIRAASHEIERALRRMRTQIGALAAGQQELAKAAQAHEARLGAADDRLRALETMATELQQLATVVTTTAWVRAFELDESLMISVIMPTRNRSACLPSAINSVITQTYKSWELIVVDDGSTDDTALVLEKLAHDQMQTIVAGGLGCAGARNLALAQAQGEVVVYLDDDNRFDPDWLKAVAWAFSTYAGVDVAYGARIIDDFDRVRGLAEGALPAMQFVPWDRQALERYNLIDMNVLAHRRSVGAQFDERFDHYADWDLALRLTEESTPLQLPVIAAYYTTTAPNRLSDSPDLGRELQHDEVMASLRRRSADRSADHANKVASRE